MVTVQDWRPGILGSSLGRAASELWQFRLPPRFQCLLEETLMPGGPFYVVYMSGEVKYSAPVVNSEIKRLLR